MSCAASPSGRECSLGTNPRKAGRCFRCDQPVPAARNSSVPGADPRPIRRNPDLEREIVENATRGLNIDPSALIDHAQARATELSSEYVDDPLTIRPGVDQNREIREEFADVVNRALFKMQEHMDQIGGELWHDMEIIIRGTALLYDRLLER